MNLMQSISLNNKIRERDAQKKLLRDLKPVIKEMRANFRIVEKLRKELGEDHVETIS